MKIGVIWAQGLNGVIGNAGAIPWHCPDDLKAFAETTRGQAVIMGRKTWESLPVAPLPSRMNVVVTSRPDWKDRGAYAANGLHDALMQCHGQCVTTAWVIGGVALIREALALADLVAFTTVDYNGPGDAVMPDTRWMKDYKEVGVSSLRGPGVTQWRRQSFTRTATLATRQPYAHP